MRLIRIDGAGDPRLSDFENLRHRPSGRVLDRDFFVVEGQLIVSRVLASDFQVRSVVVEEGRDINIIGDIDPQADVFVLTRDQIRALAGYDFHRGFLASVARKPLGSMTDFRPDPVSLALVQTTDMENMGSMMRTAAAFGIRQILLDQQSVDPYSRRAMRVSMGAALGMRFLTMEDPKRDLQVLTERGVISLAATLAVDSKPIDQIPSLVGPGQPLLLVMGNEANGLPAEVQAASTRRVIIPMDTANPDAQRDAVLVDSLNVSVAAAILMYELTRQPR